MIISEAAIAIVVGPLRVTLRVVRGSRSLQVYCPSSPLLRGTHLPRRAKAARMKGHAVLVLGVGMMLVLATAQTALVGCSDWMR